MRLVVLLAASVFAQPRPAIRPAAVTPEYTYGVVNIFPHDRSAFTQGLEYHDGSLYEGTGLHGHSSVRKVRLETGDVLRRVNLDSHYFGEGITIIGEELFQLTWQNGVGFVYALEDLRLRRRFTYRGEGWGLTNDGREIFMSDGTSQLRVLDPTNMTERRRVDVRDNGSPIQFLNELEYVEGEIWANVWQTDRIARISPSTGQVTGWIDLKGLLSPMFSDSADVLNGIAYDAKGKRIFVTGKLWPNLFQIRVIPKNRRATEPRR
jgi:glutaminyl-peptide cyclotransferase